MIPQEKAKEIYEEIFYIISEVKTSSSDSYLDEDTLDNKSKDLALYMIKKKLETISGLEDSVWAFNMKSFWKEVKKEIINL